MHPDHARSRAPLNASGEPLKIPCKFCNKDFVPSRPWQLFCCPAHRSSYWNIQYILDAHKKGPNNDDQSNS